MIFTNMTRYWNETNQPTFLPNKLAVALVSQEFLRLDLEKRQTELIGRRKGIQSGQVIFQSQTIETLKHGPVTINLYSPCPPYNRILQSEVTITSLSLGERGLTMSDYFKLCNIPSRVSIT